MDLDSTCLGIIRHLQNGSKSYKEISEEMDITENTVRIRAKKLLKEGVLEICGSVDPLNMSDHGLAIVGVKLTTTDLIKKGEAFSKLKGVAAVGVGTGRYDLILIVLFKENSPLTKFFTEEVVKVKDVQNAETFVVYHSFNFLVPYVL